MAAHDYSETAASASSPRGSSPAIRFYSYLSHYGRCAHRIIVEWNQQPAADFFQRAVTEANDNAETVSVEALQNILQPHAQQFSLVLRCSPPKGTASFTQVLTPTVLHLSSFLNMVQQGTKLT